jgi:hypothetical protein
MTAIPSSSACGATVQVGDQGDLYLVMDNEGDPREWQYVYEDGDGYVFLDTATEVPITLPRECVGEARQFLHEGARLRVVGGRP